MKICIKNSFYFFSLQALKTLLVQYKLKITINLSKYVTYQSDSTSDNDAKFSSQRQ